MRAGALEHLREPDVYHVHCHLHGVHVVVVQGAGLLVALVVAAVMTITVAVLLVAVLFFGWVVGGEKVKSPVYL